MLFLRYFCHFIKLFLKLRNVIQILSRYLTEKKLYIVCYSKRICDKNSYRQGGLGRCTEEKAAERLLNRKEEYLKDKDGKHFAAANRLQMIISGECHDIFAARCLLS